MGLWGVLLALTCGCTRVVVIEAAMPPLLPMPGNETSVAVGPFTAENGTERACARAVERMLADELRSSRTPHRLAPSADAAQIVVSGRVSCRVTDETVQRPFETVRVRIPDVAVTFVATAGKSIKLFTATEAPSAEDRGRFAEAFPSVQKLKEGLLRACVEAFVSDISPRPTRVKIPRPILRGNERTKEGIDLLAEDPAQAILKLTKAAEENPEDAAAANALGFCSEVNGNLELAVWSYTLAASLEDLGAYRENLERTYGLLERRKRLLGIAD
jgi:hypothetical protein